VGSVIPSIPVISLSTSNNLAFPGGHDDVNRPIGISVAGHRNDLVRVERVVLMAISGVHATTLLEFFWVQVGHSLGPFQCSKDGTIGHPIIWKQLLVDLST
jgi:hypothetical protein